MSYAAQVLFAFALGYFATSIAIEHRPEPPRAAITRLAVALDCPGQIMVRSVVGDFCR